MARVTGAELRSLRAEADRVAGIADRLRDAVATVADATAVEVEAVRAAAEQRPALSPGPPPVASPLGASTLAAPR